ncbi:hypothetical protein TKK_0013340 [Trichogramma kaykai]
MQALSKNTIKQYSPTIVHWMKHCKEAGIDCYTANVEEIISYLTVKFHEGASYGTLNSAKAAIGTILNYSITNNIILKKFFNGIYRMRPTRPKYNRTWDVSLVLNLISTCSDFAMAIVD